MHGLGKHAGDADYRRDYEEQQSCDGPLNGVANARRPIVISASRSVHEPSLRSWLRWGKRTG